MDILAIICCATAGIASALSLLPTYAAWKSKALGPGGRWPDPILAALFGNAAWFAFGCIQGSDEAFWLNGFCGVVQMVNLGVYFALCPEDKRLAVIEHFLLAGCYLALTVWVGVVDDSVDVFKVFCTFSGVAAAFVPIFTTTFCMSGRKTVDLLPHWAVSLVSLTNAVLWVVRGLLISNIPVAIQNGAGAIASVCFLVLVFVWDDEPADENDYVPVPDREDNSGSDDDDETSEPADENDYVPPDREDNSASDDDDKTSEPADDNEQISIERASASSGSKNVVVGVAGDTTKFKRSDDEDEENELKTSDLDDDKSYLVNEKTGCSSHNSLGCASDSARGKDAMSGTGRDTPKDKISDIGDEMSFVNEKTEDSSLNPTGGASAPAYEDDAIDVEEKAGGSGGAPNKTSPVPAAPEAEIVEVGVQE